MRALIAILLALLLAIGIAGFASNNTGHLILTYSDWSIQTSLMFFLAVLFVFFVVLYMGIRSLVNLLELPKQINIWRKHRHQQLSEKFLARGLHALIEGNWHQAEGLLNKGASFSRVPLINYLGAARAAQQQGALHRRDNYLKLAYEDSPGGDVAVGLTQAELLISQQQTEQALATLSNLNEQNPNHAQVKRMLLQMHSNLGDWHVVLEILSELKRSKSLAPENIRAKQLEAYAGLLHQAGDAANKEALDNSWNNIPKKFRSELHLIEVYTTERLKFADTMVCEPLLRKALKNQWDVSLVRLYGLVESKDGAKQLTFAEGLLQGHARDPVLLFTLGRFSARNNLWGKARTYLEESIEIQATPEACRELAALLEGQGEHSAAAVYYQQGLTLATAITQHDSVKLLEQTDTENTICEGARQVV
ncbi:MAG: heme biosynthesis HemY N-terminal domain-containing protein [Gammaproteobacteria bacterium]